MNTLLIIELILGVAVSLIFWLWLWKTRDRTMATLSLQQEWRRSWRHLAGLCAYALQIIWTVLFVVNYYGEDGTWHQIIVEEKTSFSAFMSDISPFFAVMAYLITGVAVFLYAKTRLPYFAKIFNLPYFVTVLGTYLTPFLAQLTPPKWLYIFWFMAIASVVWQIIASFISLNRRSKTNKFDV
nr:methane monooxygenase/ammonia monooxygenase subunit C [Crenothrix polyspora]